MAQSAFDFSDFSWVAFPLEGAAQGFEPSIAFRFPAPISRFFGEQPINRFLQGDLTLLKLRQNIGDQLFHRRRKIGYSSAFATAMAFP